LKVFGLIGEKLGHSLSPIIHQMIYKIIDIDASYSLFEVKPDMLKSVVEGIRALNINGVNVTIPYKVRLMEHLDDISTEAKKIGAVNTILNKGSYLTGYNTDYIGFGKMLDKYGINVAGKTAVVLGTGGAAKSIVTCLEDKAVGELYIISRNPDRITDFNKNHKLITYEDFRSVKKASLLINCTPIGMYPNIIAALLPQSQVVKFDTVCDLIYNPSCTQLMQQAKDSGIPAYNGLYMLVSQAVAAVEIWNDIKIPEEIVDNVFEELKNHLTDKI
jgi:shikimate dehydrogenase